MKKLAPGAEPGSQDVTGYALTGWGRTARLCAIRLTEAIPALATLAVMLAMRR